MRGLGLIVYGIEGIGKTTFSLQFPKPLNIMSIRETGYEDLNDVGEVPAGVVPLIVKNWEDIRIAVEACQAKTLVIDSVSGLQEFAIKHITATQYGGSYKAFKAFYNGLRQDCPRAVEELIDFFEFKRAQGTNIILIAHRQNDVEPDSGGPDTKIQTLFGDVGITGPFMKWAQAILFMSGKKNVDIVTQSSGTGNDVKILQGKSTGKPTRLMYTEYSGYHVAKNKLKLPSIIPMGSSAAEGYKNFHAALPENIQKALAETK